MKVPIFVVLPALLFLSSCGGTKFLVEYDDVTKIVLYFGGGLPPSPEDASISAYNWWTTFTPDGKVEYIISSYNSTLLMSENWQVTSENFKLLLTN